MRLASLFLAILLPFFSTAATDYNDKVSLIKQPSTSQEDLLKWQDDILYPHLYGHWLSQNITRISQAQAEHFLNQEDYKAAAYFFKPQWRRELVRRKAWRTINKSFASLGDPELLCHYFEAKKALGEQIPYEKVETLWLSGKSRPDHCDPFFAEWINQLENPDPFVWKRQLKAFYKRNGKLVRYLNKFYVSEDAKSHGQFLTDVYNDPKKLVSQSYNPNSEKMHTVALAAVNRMAFQDPKSASNLWLAIVKVTPSMTPDEIREASRFLGIAMAKNALPQASYWLTIADPKKADEEVQHWRLQIALTDKNYEKVSQLYSQLSSELQQSSQWQYWYGISQLKLTGQLTDSSPLHALSKRRLYYGYLASGVLGKAPSLNATQPDKSDAAQSLASEKAMQRARALYEAGAIRRAQVEWNLFIRNKDNDLQHAAAELAMSWGWHAKASQAAGWSGRYSLIHLRYPDAYEKYVAKHAKQLDIPKYWVYGVMRQESMFEHTAISPAGARGLMQIMPRTARVTAKKYNIQYSGVGDLHYPATNIAIGTHYLDELFEKYDHPVFATAAYNAGPSRVNTWRNRFPNEITIWIESIPFNETRNYVKSVLAYSQIYALRHNTDWHLASWTQPNTAFAQID